ncbi:MAG: hypothetical protein COA38_21795 [Fluviicola sp.]|nr:MAG: hypothetical protein COA38_21795 [Fluviicola sp.]
MLKDFFFFIIDTLMGWGISLLDTITAPLSVFSPQQYINLIPADMLNVMGLIGLGDAMAIIVAALLIRLTMQLIPFVRLGS